MRHVHRRGGAQITLDAMGHADVNIFGIRRQAHFDTLPMPRVPATRSSARRPCTRRAHLKALQGRQVSVVSILKDRLTVSAFEIDIAENEGRTLITPVRQRAGRGSAQLAAARIEEHLLASFSDQRLVRQLVALGAVGELARCGNYSGIFQQADGTWGERKIGAPVDGALERDIADWINADLEFMANEIEDGSLVLIEAADAERSFRRKSWGEIYASRLRAKGITDIHLLPADAAVSGAGEYCARLQHKVATYFDYINAIEIAALEKDTAGHAFIPLFPEETRVPGNQEFKRSLSGRFMVQPGSTKLEFHLWRQDEAINIRQSTTALDPPSKRDVPITIEVTQRPASGYAAVEVLPDEPGALGTQRILLDWEKMEVLSTTRDELVRRLDEAMPHYYPNIAPIQTDARIWPLAEIEDTLRWYLSAIPGDTPSFRKVIKALQRKASFRVKWPTYHSINLPGPLYLVDSQGRLPAGLPAQTQDLFAKVRAKISSDLASLGGRKAWAQAPGRPIRVVSNLILAGSWLFGSAPEACLEYFRDVFRNQAAIGTRVEAIGRAVSREEDITLALQWLIADIRKKFKDKPDKPAVTRQFKAIANILQYHEESCLLLTDADALTLCQAAMRNLGLEMKKTAKDGRPKALSFTFTHSAGVFLLALRRRRGSPTFLTPPRGKIDADPVYLRFEERLVSLLAELKAEVSRGRKVHAQAVNALEQAIEFLRKTGGDPNIIIAIAGSEGDEEDGEEEAGEGNEEE